MSPPTPIPLWAQRLQPRARAYLTIVVSVSAGLAAAVMLHYLLYRLGLPSRPFIYVSF